MLLLWLHDIRCELVCSCAKLEETLLSCIACVLVEAVSSALKNCLTIIHLEIASESTVFTEVRRCNYLIIYVASLIFYYR